MGDTTESKLIDQALDGDPLAFEAILNRHYKQLYQYLFHLTMDSHLAADLTQDTFTSAWQSLDQFRQDASVRTWLYQIGYRKFIDQCRKQGRNDRARCRVAEGWNEVAECEKLRGIIRDEQQKLLVLSLDRLDDKDRHVLVLRYLQGMSVTDTAEVMNEPIGTTKWRCANALESLRGILSRESAHVQ